MENGRIILAISLSFIVGYSIHTVYAQSFYCDRELWIFLFNNNLEVLQDCINSPDISQDIKLSEIENRLNATETRLDILERPLLK